jgi:MSHA pilin protein MshC
MKHRPVTDMRKASGFTLVELVTTMIVLAILAVAILPRFANRQSFDARGYYDQAKSAVEFARKAAIAERRNVCVAIAAGTLTITRGVTFGAACTVPLVNPTTGAAFSLPAPAGVALATTAATFSFDALGGTPAAVTITVDGTRQIVVEAETGYVH